MPLVTTLLQDPNQTFSSVLENDSYEIEIKTVTDFTYISINRNGEQVISAQKCNINQDILLYDYQFNNFGNFRFSSNSDVYPNFNQFGVSVFFIYITKSEVSSGL